MIQRLSHATYFVLDQDSAKDFYVGKLGFELRVDQTMDNGFRWLTVSPKGQPELEIVLMKVDGPNIKPQASAAIKQLLELGALGAGVMTTADCRKTHEELTAKGVEFKSPPKEQFYGVEATFRDDSGNWFSLSQPKSA